MKYEIYAVRTGRVLGWGVSVTAAVDRARFFLDANPIIHIRERLSKKVVRIMKKDDDKPKKSSLPV